MSVLILCSRLALESSVMKPPDAKITIIMSGGDLIKGTYQQIHLKI
jgi:hypothetical protein